RGVELTLCGIVGTGGVFRDIFGSPHHLGPEVIPLAG
ncbi:hypothetical protein RSAG8_03627, partial [Rhizoctonia solani AG-8 WAC10335]